MLWPGTDFGMRIELWNDESLLLAVYPDGGVVTPTDENERTACFAALCDALALLGRIKPQAGIHATAGGMAECSKQNPQHRADCREVVCGCAHDLHKRRNQGLYSAGNPRQFPPRSLIGALAT